MKTMDELIQAVQDRNWNKVRTLSSDDKVALDLKKAARHVKRTLWKPYYAKLGSILVCEIPGTKLVAVVERRDVTWKLTCILSTKDRPAFVD